MEIKTNMKKCHQVGLTNKIKDLTSMTVLIFELIYFFLSFFRFENNF